LVNKLIYGVVTLATIAGCSAKARIDTAAIEVATASQVSSERFVTIDELASSSEARFIKAGDLEGAAEQQLIQTEATEGQYDQFTISEYASDIRTNLHGVEDIVPWWATMLGRISIAVAIVAVLIFLWRSGILSLIKSAVWGIGLLIPKQSKREVNLDLKAMSAESAVTMRETVAAKRASDPAYAAAYDHATRNNK
tara:strand:+ start:350 stop:937 length:588 start_codon:yes stop_codon:yes gene_type:complete